MINFGDLAIAAPSVALGFNILVNAFTVAMTPVAPTTEDFFQVHSITAERFEQTAILHVDRDILAPIEMSFAVRVMGWTGTGWREHCSMASGVIEYQPGTELPDPITLSWWTWVECPLLPDGRAQIRTTWTPADDRLAPVSVTTEVEQ